MTVLYVLGGIAVFALLARAADRWLRRNIANKEF